MNSGTINSAQIKICFLKIFSFYEHLNYKNNVFDRTSADGLYYE